MRNFDFAHTKIIAKPTTRQTVLASLDAFIGGFIMMIFVLLSIMVMWLIFIK